MSEKYEDLASRISDDLEPTMAGEAYIRNSLRWLDEHPDQVPGRTITESGWIEACKATMGGDMVAPFALATRLGVTITPDPEPTNRDRLQGWLVEFAERNASCGGERGDCDLAEFLDAHGVKAPGGDDE